MSAVSLTLGGDPPLRPVRLRGEERLGEASIFEVDLEGPWGAPVMPSDVLRGPATLSLETAAGARVIAGVVTRFAVVAGDPGEARRYHMTVQSRFALLSLRRAARVFQDRSIPQIIEEIVRAGGYASVHRRRLGAYPERRRVTQYLESDAAFVRRLCEEHGLYFYFEAEDGGEAFVLEDDSTGAEGPYPDGVTLARRIAWDDPRAAAIDVARARHAAPGSVTLRDENPDHPSLALEASARDGDGAEQDIEVYEAPGKFTDPREGAGRARLVLQSLRARASRVRFGTNGMSLAPGARCALVEDPTEDGDHRLAGDHVVIAASTRWDAREGELGATLDGVPAAVPFRLPRVTPRPRVAGVQSAWVSGERGMEIQPDALGRVRLRFHWDRYGAEDHRTSLPARVLQPNLPGPMLVPRAGWEVFTMFEDGDPDRPYVIGRSFNAIQPPPLPLPANKTVSSIATDSSPGAGGRTVIQMDDAAGREHLLVRAPGRLNETVAGKRTVQISKNENVQVGADLSESIGGHDALVVHAGLMAGYGSRHVTVNAAQYQTAGGDFVTKVGTEAVAVGGAVAEQVGNPVKGAANLGFSKGLASVSALGVAGRVGAGVAGAARAAVEGYGAKGEAGAMEALQGSALGNAASLVPGGDAILAYVRGSSTPMPWDKGRPAAGAPVGGGGASGASGASGGPGGPGPGHRTIVASASYSEVVGAVSSVVTPGPVSWVTAGAASTLINGSHASTAVQSGLRAAGGLVESSGSSSIQSKGALAKQVTGAMSSRVRGALCLSAGGDYVLAAKSTLTLKVGGDLALQGSTVTFTCGAARITASGAGVTLEAPSIAIHGSSRQSGSLTHR